MISISPMLRCPHGDVLPPMRGGSISMYLCMPCVLKSTLILVRQDVGDPFNHWGEGGDVTNLSPFWEETARK